MRDLVPKQKEDSERGRHGVLSSGGVWGLCRATAVCEQAVCPANGKGNICHLATPASVHKVEARTLDTQVDAIYEFLGRIFLSGKNLIRKPPLSQLWFLNTRMRSGEPKNCHSHSQSYRLDRRNRGETDSEASHG